MKPALVTEKRYFIQCSHDGCGSKIAMSNGKGFFYQNDAVNAAQEAGWFIDIIQNKALCKAHMGTPPNQRKAIIYG